MEYFLGDLKDDVRVTVGGSSYQGWEDFSVDFSIDSVNIPWSLTGTTRKGFYFPGGFKKFQQVAITSSNDRVLTGQIMKVEYSRDVTGGTRITISGDGKAVNAVQSKHMGYVQYNKMTAAQAIRRVLEPFGLDLIDEVKDPQIFDRITYQGDTTAIDFAAQIARLVGGTLLSDEYGRIINTRYRNQQLGGSVVSGINALNGWKVEDDGNFQFSTYSIRASKNNDDGKNRGQVVNQIEYEEPDPFVPVYRPFTFKLDGDVSHDQAKTHARLEMTRRGGLAQKIICQTAGWQNLKGKLWKPNRLVYCHFPLEDGVISQYMLVEKVRFQKTRATGSVTNLVLVPREAYQAEPKKAKKAIRKPAGSGYTPKPATGWLKKFGG